MKQYRIDLASLALRIALGGMLLSHGLFKLFILTPHGTAQYFQDLGFQPLLGYLTILSEIVGGIFLLIGLLSQLVAFFAMIQMLFIIFVHYPNGWVFSNIGGGWEYPAFMAVTALALTFLSDGRYSLMSKLRQKSQKP